MKKNLLTLLMALLCASHTFATDIYVDLNATPGGDGTSWSSAFQDLQSAVNASGMNDFILIAEGIYRPEAEIEIGHALSLKGGYPTGGGAQDISVYTTQIQADFDPNDLLLNIFDISSDASVFMEGIRFFNTIRVMETRSDLVLNEIGFEGGTGRSIRFNAPVAMCVITNSLFSDNEDALISESSVNGPETLIITNTVFENGSGRILLFGDDQLDLRLTNCILRNYNTADQTLLQISTANVTMDNFLVENNQVGTGRIMLHSDGNLHIKDSSFINNTGDGTLCVQSFDGVVLIENSDFSNNTAIGSAFPKPVFNINDSELTAINCSFNNNYAEGSQPDAVAAIRSDDLNAMMTFEGCEFKNNQAVGSIAYIVDVSYGASLVVNNCLFDGNIGDTNNAINMFSNIGAVLTNNTFKNHNTDDFLIDWSNNILGDIQLENNLFMNNDFTEIDIDRAANGIFANNVFKGAAELRIDRVTNATFTKDIFTGNTGGEVFIVLDESEAILDNVVMISAKPSGTHKVIESRIDASAQILNSSFSAASFNDTHVFIDFNEGLPSSIQNSIVWSGSSLTQEAIDASTNVTVDYSLLKGLNPSGTGNLNGTQASNAPVFAGPSVFDIRELDCSPTVNSGSNAQSTQSTDQSGNPRVFETTVDMGGYELQIPENSTCTAPVLPSCVSIIEPINGDVEVDTLTSISWENSTNAIGYLVSIGTTSGGVEIVNNDDVGSMTTYNPTIDLPDGATIYVTITPYNAVGSAANCAEASFTTRNAFNVVAMCKNYVAELDATGNVIVEASDVDNGSFDPDGAVTLAIDNSEFDCSNIGFNLVTLTVTDSDNNETTCQATVQVVDSTSPAITCPSSPILVGGVSEFVLPDYVVLGEVSVNDNCSGVTYIQTPEEGTLIGEGDTIVTIAATDTSGNEITCEFTVNVDPNLGMENLENLSSLTVYPNPANQFISIANPNHLDVSKASLFDITGRLVQVAYFSQNADHTSINLDEQASGSYYLQLEGKGTIKTFHVIIR